MCMQSVVTKRRHEDGCTMTLRLQRRSRSVFLALLVIALCNFQNAIAATKRAIGPSRRRNDLNRFLHDTRLWRRRLEQEDAKTINCEAIGKCEMCTDAERAEEGSECASTGRHIKYKCTESKGEEEISSSVSYKSCHRTEADEEFLMMRLQAVWFTIGVVSLFSVRRNKQVGASLFDQRKAAAKQQQQQNSLSLTVEQEMVPLTSTDSDPLDVV